MINEIQRSITRVVEGKDLSRDEAARAFQIMMAGGATPAQMAALLVALRVKGETVEEITGAALAMRAKMETIAAPAGAIDVCGMGGDARSTGGTLNVSSAVALVVAACGVPVVKHGNKSVSSASGSADVFAALGVNVQAVKHVMEQALNEAGICFLFAPMYHKATRHVAPVRQELGLRTIFNMLGPLANPASPVRQLMGVYDKALLGPVAQVLRELGSQTAWVVHGSDGMDELTITGESHVVELSGADMRSFTVTPEEAGLERAEAQALVGTTVEGNARELGLLLHGKRSAYRDIVLLNASAALMVAGRAAGLREGVGLAAAAIDEGRAKEALANLARITQAI